MTRCESIRKNEQVILERAKKFLHENGRHSSFTTEISKKINEEKGPSGQTWEALISVALTNPKNPEKLPEWKAAAQWWSNETIKKQSLALANSFKKEFIMDFIHENH